MLHNPSPDRLTAWHCGPEPRFLSQSFQYFHIQYLYFLNLGFFAWHKLLLDVFLKVVVADLLLVTGLCVLQRTNTGEATETVIVHLC